MRKQITLPDSLNDVLKRFAKVSKTSESNVISFALMSMCQDFNTRFQYLDGEKDFIQTIKNFYVDFYCKKLPRGLKAEKGGKNA